MASLACWILCDVIAGEIITAVSSFVDAPCPASPRRASRAYARQPRSPGRRRCLGLGRLAADLGRPLVHLRPGRRVTGLGLRLGGQLLPAGAFEELLALGKAAPAMAARERILALLHPSQPESTRPCDDCATRSCAEPRSGHPFAAPCRCEPPGPDRTDDLPLTRRLLWPLSYGGRRLHRRVAAIARLHARRRPARHRGGGRAPRRRRLLRRRPPSPDDLLHREGDHQHADRHDDGRPQEPVV